MSLNFLQWIVAEVRVVGLRGEKGLGFSRLLFDLELSMPAWTERDYPVLLDLGGDLYANSVQGVRHPVGRLRPANGPIAIAARQSASKVRETLEVELDGQRLERVEELRKGSSLTFALSLRGLFLRGGEFCPTNDDLPYEANQGEWIELLGQLGHAQILLLEIPLPEPDGQGELAQAASFLSKARETLFRGDYRGAVGLCRDVLESLEVIEDKEQEEFSDSDPPEDPRSLNKEGRISKIEKALRTFAHAAKHADKQTVNIEWDRRDAVMAVTMTAALLQRRAKVHAAEVG